MNKSQLKQANRLLMLAIFVTMLFNIIGLKALHANAEFAGVSPSLAMFNMICYIVVLVAYFVVFFLKPDTKALFYMVAISFTILYIFSFYVTKSNSAYPYIIPVLMVFLVYRDSKVINTVAIIQLIANLVMAGTILATAENFRMVQESVSLEMIVSILTCICPIVSNRLIVKFNNESSQVIQENVERQRDMTAEVVEYAKQVLDEVQSTKTELDEIYSTTQSINGALSDIAGSTASTAEAVEHQTEMTGSIQGVIQETYEKTTGIVDITAETSQVVEGGVLIADKLNHTAETSMQA